MVAKDPMAVRLASSMKHYQTCKKGAHTWSTCSASGSSGRDCKIVDINVAGVNGMMLQGWVEDSIDIHRKSKSDLYH